jgi:phosphohistidine phosphatase
MKTLLLLRHAKSSWKDASLEDFNRPLNERGRKAADLIGKFLARQKLELDLVVTSPAQRARETTERVLRSARIAPEQRFDQRIYEATPATLLEVVSQIDDDKKTVLLVGHNPGMEELLALLVGGQEHMVTAALAKINLSIKKWEKVAGAQGELEFFTKPKELGGE